MMMMMMMMMINITFQTICKYVTFQKIKKELNSK